MAQAAADLRRHQDETQAAAAAKEKHLAEQEEVKARLASLTKAVEETSGRHREAESRSAEAESEAQRRQTVVDTLIATAGEKASLVASLDERHVLLTDAAAKFAREEEAGRERLAVLEGQLREHAELLETKRIKVAEAGERLAAVEKRSLEFEARLEELNEVEQRLAQAKDSLAATRATEADVRARTEAVRKDRETLHQEHLRLQHETASHGQIVATLRLEHEAEKLRLQQTRDHLERETNRAGGVRNEITVLLATLASRQKEAEDAANQVADAADRLTHLERRALELRDIDEQTSKARAALEAVEIQRRQLQLEADELASRNETLSQQLNRLEQETADERERGFSAAEAAGQRLAELAGLDEQAAAAREDLAQMESAQEEAASALKNAQAESDTIHALSTRLNMEVAAAQTALHELVARRTSEEERSVQLASVAIRTRQETEEAGRLLDGLRQQCAEEQESLQRLRDQIAEENDRLAGTRRGVETTAKQLADLEDSLGARERTLTGSVADLETRVEDLRREEHGLDALLQKNRERLRHREASLEEVQGKLAADEARYAALLSRGEKLLSLDEALSIMEEKERAAGLRSSEAAEQELALQVKLSALNESVAKEQQKLDQTRRERAHEEEDRASALEKAGRDLEEARHRAVEEAKLSEIALTAKLKERVRELEAKHEVLRRSLQASLDEQTVILFANDLIKRIDLIDILIQRVTGPGINGGMEQQLRTLRASFEDILEQHGIAEFKVAPGTEVNVDLRQRIAIVESVSGPARPRVVESYRPGFVYCFEDGREVVLRKVEVKTSSE